MTHSTSKAITIIYEDEPSGAVIERILAYYRPDLTIKKRVICYGCGKIKSNLSAYNKTAQAGFPYFILTDLDRDVCAPHLIEQWSKKTQIHANLLFRVAVREVESWIMADRENFAHFLGIPVPKIDFNTDSILDPKQAICNWARKSRKKEIRLGIPPKNDYAVQGETYVVQIVQFINNAWNVANATESSPSLKRTVERLQNWLK